MTELQKIVKYLMDNGLVSSHRGKLVFTAKFNKEYSGQSVGLVPTATVPAVRTPGLGVVGGIKLNDWRQRYIQFISDCHIPPRAYNREGQPYDINKYSEDAMKVFRTAIEKEGVDYDILVATIALYYQGDTDYKKSITNYMVDGTWRGDYIAMTQSIADGTIAEHINTQTGNNGNPDRFRIG